MARISNDFAYVVATRIADKAVEERRAALVVLQDKLFEDIYDHLVTQAQQKAMQKLPENFFESRQTWYMPHRDYTHRELQHSTKSFRMPAFCSSSVRNEHLTPELGLRLQERNGEIDSIFQHRNDIFNSARAKIKSAGTLKRLLESWPTVKDYLEEDELKQDKVALPALTFEDLERMIAKAAVVPGAAKHPSEARKKALAQLAAQKEAA